MCSFFSFLGDGYGNYKYCDWDIRKKWLMTDKSPDSHTTILTHFKIPARMQDRWSKYEFNPITKQFTVDQGVEGHDHASAETWVNGLGFKTIVPALIIKPIFNPLFKIQKVADADIVFLKEWASVWDSVGGSVRDSVWAYISSYFDVKYKYNFSSCIELWNKGLVPAFDGTNWYLCSGKNAKIIYTWKKGEE